jgi:hypothetical protein
MGRTVPSDEEGMRGFSPISAVSGGLCALLMEIGGFVGTPDDEIVVDEEEDPRPSSGGDDGDDEGGQNFSHDFFLVLVRTGDMGGVRSLLAHH